MYDSEDTQAPVYDKISYDIEEHIRARKKARRAARGSRALPRNRTRWQKWQSKARRWLFLLSLQAYLLARSKNIPVLKWSQILNRGGQ